MASERDMMYIVLLAIVMNVNGGEVSISIESDGYPSHFYNGTNVNFTCTVHDIAGFTNLQKVGLYDGSDTAGCFYSVLGGWSPDVALSNKLDLTLPTNEHCQSTPSRSSVSIVGTVNEKMKDVQLYCVVLDGSSVIKSNEKVNISEIRVRPMNLIMSSPEIAKRNELITFNCTSEGAIPASQFNYKIRQNGREVASSSDTPPNYTPPSDSTGNFTLECEDRIHLNLTSNVRFTKYIPLHYLDPPLSTERSIKLNPSSARLECNVNGFPVTYIWACDDCTPADNSRVWGLQSSRQNGQVETITCTASVDSLPSMTITWEVTWSDAAPTPPPTATPTSSPATSPTKKAGPDPVVIAVPIVAVVVLAAIAIGVFCWCKKKRSAPAGSKSANGDPEQMKMTNKSRGTEPGSNMPGKPKHQKSTKQKKAAETPNAPATSPRKYPNDTIIYAELDHGTRPPQTAVVKPNQQPPPPPQETVEYASIDIAKTRQYNQKGDGDAYMNVSKQKSQRSASPSQPLDRPPPPPSTH